MEIFPLFLDGTLNISNLDFAQFKHSLLFGVLWGELSHFINIHKSVAARLKLAGAH